MRTLLTVLAILLLTAAGCRHPNEVELTPDLSDNEMEVTSLASVDTTYSHTAVDTTALLPSDELRFGAFLLINNVTYDAGPMNRAQAVVATAYVADLSRPLVVNGRVVGYYGINLYPTLFRPITINGLAMLPVPHRIRVRTMVPMVKDTVVHWGFEYVRLLPSFEPNGVYTWSAQPDSIGAISTSIVAPESIAVHAPLGGSVLSRNQDLMLRWTGQGDLSIIVSLVDPGRKLTKPLLKIRPRVNRGRLLLSAKILRLLPRDRYFAFTFVLATRKESTVVNQYAGKVLVQAASMHNCYVQFQ